MKNILSLGTRASKLAIIQSQRVAKLLEKKNIATDIHSFSSYGDENLEENFLKLKNRGLFVSTLEKALMNKKIDIAVHSYKDLPCQENPFLSIPCILDCMEKEDILLIHPDAYDIKQLWGLKKNAIIGTSSPRRSSQLISFRPDCQPKDLRGNIGSRIEKLKNKKYDAIILATAGLERLKEDLSAFKLHVLDSKLFIPAAGQGALALQTRAEDKNLIRQLKQLEKKNQGTMARIEKAVLQSLSGGCAQPVGVMGECRAENKKMVYISYAQSPKSFALQYAYDFDAKKNIQQYFHHSYKPSFKSLFISRTLSAETYLYLFLQHYKIKTRQEALIDSKAISYRLEAKIADYDGIFFTSGEAVKFFFQKHCINIPIGVIGQGTALAVQQKGIYPSFCGTGESTQSIAENFARKYRGKKILLPQAKKSTAVVFNTLQQYCKVDRVLCYDNMEKKKINPIDSEIMCFTSPSNVKAYFKEHTSLDFQKFIAIGPHTFSTLEKFVVKNKILLPPQYNLQGIAQCLLSI